jgi:hypothetical protein
MPKRLLDRRQVECIREFRATARERFNDGLSLAAAGRRTGAIYIWGYSVEMLIKAAYFSVIGYADVASITWPADLTPAIQRGRNMGIAWPPKGAGHNIVAWAELLVSERVSLGLAYSQQFALDVQTHSNRVWQHWRETLRYHKNNAYMHEMNQVRLAAEWFLVNGNLL